MLKQYNTKVTSEEENIHVQQMYHKLGYNSRTKILTSQQMRDDNYGDDYVVGAVYANISGYITVDCVENVERNFKDEYELTIEELEKMVKVLEPKKIDLSQGCYINTEKLSSKDIFIILNKLEDLGCESLATEDEYLEELQMGYKYLIIDKDSKNIFTATTNRYDTEITYQELKEMVNKTQVLWVNTFTGELQQHNKGVKVKDSEWEVVPEDADVVVNLGCVVATYKDQFKQAWVEGHWCNTIQTNENIEIWNNSPILWQREGAVVKADLIVEGIQTSEIEYSLFLNTLTSTVQTLPSHAGDDEGSALIKLLEDTEVVTQVEDVYLAWNSFGQVCSVKAEENWRNGAHRNAEEYIKDFEDRVKILYDVRAKVTVNKYENHLKHLDIFLNGGKVQFRTLGTKQWHNLTQGALQHITRENIEFRETPPMIVVDDISFEHKEDAIAFIQNKY